jgi:hypothetical protein
MNFQATSSLPSSKELTNGIARVPLSHLLACNQSALKSLSDGLTNEVRVNIARFDQINDGSEWSSQLRILACHDVGLRKVCIVKAEYSGISLLRRKLLAPSCEASPG